MWRAGLIFAAILGIAIAPAEAARPTRAPCAEGDSILCNVYRGNPASTAQKFTRSRSHRVGTKTRVAPGAATNAPSAQPIPAGAKPVSETAPAKLLAARGFDSLGSGTDSSELTALSRGTGVNPWLKPILIVLTGGGILSLFVAKAADL